VAREQDAQELRFRLAMLQRGSIEFRRSLRRVKMNLAVLERIVREGEGIESTTLPTAPSPASRTSETSEQLLSRVTNPTAFSQHELEVVDEQIARTRGIVEGHHARIVALRASGGDKHTLEMLLSTQAVLEQTLETLRQHRRQILTELRKALNMSGR
jgi:hypothetical protein